VEGVRVFGFEQFEEALGGLVGPELNTTVLSGHLGEAGSDNNVETVRDMLSLHSELTDSYRGRRVEALRAIEVRAVKQSVVQKHQSVDIEMGGEGFDQDH
jgi:hypothetical protein